MNESKIPGNAPDEKNIDTLREDIRTSRERVGQDVEALAEKLTPENLKEGAKHAAIHVKDQAVGAVKERAHDAAEAVKERAQDAAETVREKAHDAVDTVREQAGVAAETLRSTGQRVSTGARAHAVPLALIGGGLTWLTYDLYFSGRGRWRRGSMTRERERFEMRGRGYMGEPTYYGESYEGGMREEGGERLIDQASEGAAEARERVREGAAEVRGRFEEARGELGERVQHAKEDLKGRMERVRGGAGETIERVETRAKRIVGNVREQLDANPMGMALVSFAVGTGVGMLLPTTRRETQALGAAKDRVVHSVREKAQDVKEIAAQSARAAGETARNEASQRGLTPRS